jgi:glycosyltransferase involved in cell wall biosynthesis
MSNMNASKSLSISVVTPIFNEEESITDVVLEISHMLQNNFQTWELIAVDDGSTDNSFGLLTQLATTIPNLKLVRLGGNFGQTSAIAAGIRMASGEFVATIDADGQNDPLDIPVMLAEFREEVVMVAGWRKVRKDTLSRRLPSRIANWIISKSSGVPLHDFGCTLKIFRSEIIKDVLLIGEMHRMIPLLIKQRGGVIVEKVVNHRARIAGESKYGIGRTPRVLADLLVARFILASLSKPMHFFGKFAGLGVAIAVLSSMAALGFKISGDKDFVETPLPLLAAFSYMFASIAFLLGLVAELLVRIYFRQVGEPYRIQTVIGF